MKKLVAGIALIAVLSLSGHALAGIISNIGRKVQGEYTITIDGNQLSSKAIVIDGVSYAPVRELAEITGHKVTFDGDITLEKKYYRLGEPPLREEE